MIVLAPEPLKATLLRNSLSTPMPIHQAIDKGGFRVRQPPHNGPCWGLPRGSYTSIIVTLFRVLASLWPSQLQQWAPVILQSISASSAPEEAKVRFMKDLNEYVWTLFLPR